MPRHVDWEFLVHCDNIAANDLGNKDDYYKAIEDRYCAKYCVELGVEPLPHHKAYVARQAPLAECELEATWADSSAVASKMKIVQPQIGKHKEAVKSHGTQRNAEWFGQATYLNVMPPEPPSCVAAHFDLAAQSKSKALEQQKRIRTHAFASMKLQDMLNSDKTDDFFSLTEELERYRVRVRSDLEDESGKADVFGRLLKNKGRRDADERELENLKMKFLLPFACERSGGGNLLPWQSSEIRLQPHIRVHEDFIADAKKPISLTVAQMEEECFAYAVTRFPVELLTERADVELFAAIREQLVTEESVRLVGLLAHFLYWVVLEHIHDPAQRLPDQSKQSMVLTIQELWSLIQAPARQRLGRRGELLSKDGPAGISFVIPAFMLALKRGVEWCFQQTYPFITSEPVSNTQLVDQINIMFMRLFDPDCLYASFGSILASRRAISLWTKLSVMQASLGMTPARKVINQEFRITPLMSLLMNSDGGSPGDPKTRVLLAKSVSEPMINAHSSDPTRAQSKIPLDGWRRAALYRSANKRVNGLQRVGLECAAGKDAAITEKAKNSFMKSKSPLKNQKSRSGTHTHTRSSGRTSTVGSESTTTIHTML
jgi:hypothetical protein